MIGNELSQTALTSAHEEGGWVVDKSASSNPGSEDEDSDGEYNSCEEEEAGDDVDVDAPNEKSEQERKWCNWVTESRCYDNAVGSHVVSIILFVEDNSVYNPFGFDNALFFFLVLLEVIV